MKNLVKLAIVATIIKAVIFAVSATELPDSAHHAAIDQAVIEATR